MAELQQLHASAVAFRIAAQAGVVAEQERLAGGVASISLQGPTFVDRCTISFLQP